MIDYTPLLERIAEHGSLRRACRELRVAKSAFLEHVGKNRELADQYARARQDGIDNMMEDVLDTEITDVGKARLQWDMKRWHASKLFPKKYGDRQQLEHTGRNGGPIMTANIDLSKLSDEELEQYGRLCEKVGYDPATIDGSVSAGEGAPGA